MANTTTTETKKQTKCRFAFPGTYGHECGAPATHLLVHVMLESTKDALRGLGVVPPADGLSHVGRCETHRNVLESGDGVFVRNEPLEASC